MKACALSFQWLEACATSTQHVAVHETLFLAYMGVWNPFAMHDSCVMFESMRGMCLIGPTTHKDMEYLFSTPKNTYQCFKTYVTNSCKFVD